MRGSVVDNAEAAQNRTAPEQRSWCCINDYEDHADTVTRSSRAICVDSPGSRLWRIAEQLHPDKPLARGYVRVEKRGGVVLTSAAAAKAAALLTLHFADGAVDARVENGTRPAYAKTKDDDETRPRQQDLF